MQTTIIENPFKVGDPVRSLHNLNVLGRVYQVQYALYDPFGGLLALPMVWVDVVDGETGVLFYPEDLEICKCEDRGCFT